MITDLHIYCRQNWNSATFTNTKGEEYEIAFCEIHNCDLGFSDRELLKIEKDGVEVNQDDPIWKEIEVVIKSL